MKSMFALAAAGLTVMLTPATRAQEEKETTTGIVRASDLIGKDIKNGEGESLGDVEDIVLNSKSGEIVYMAVSYGETLGVGGKMFAITPKAFTVPQNKDHLVLNVPKATLDSQKGFNTDSWPTTADAALGRGGDGEAREENREEPAGEAAGNVIRWSQMKGAEILGRDGQRVGDVEGLALDVQNNKVQYVAMGYGGVADVGEKVFAVHFEDLQYRAEDRKFQINAVEADFQNREGFNTENWPKEADRRYNKEGE